MGVLVSHPGRQHSHQAALALQASGLLDGYWSGVPSTAEQLSSLARVWRLRLSYQGVPLERSHTKVAAWCPALRRLGGAVLPAAVARWNDLLACRLFDHWASAGINHLHPRAVIACEISAISTFRAAKRHRILGILDAPSLHHTAQDRLHGTLDSPRLHRRITRIKDAEIAAADHIVTVSELARETYLEAGIAPGKVHAVALGADLDLFRPAGAPRAESEPITFLFAGATIFRKGFDLLLTAFDHVAATEASVRLRVVGPAGEAAGLMGRHQGGRISAEGPTDQAGLVAAMQGADCLVLPSRNDSYGMVVPEALACGLPVVVSTMVGAKDLVVEGENGWVVPVDDVEALTSRMLSCARERVAVRAMREACRRSAEGATWGAYHQRFAALITSLLEAHAA
jgi:glycosyltransferase involved in cell wall biosynthesis